MSTPGEPTPRASDADSWALALMRTRLGDAVVDAGLEDALARITEDDLTAQLRSLAPFWHADLAPTQRTARRGAA